VDQEEKKKKEGFWRKGLAEVFDLPKDVIMNLPRLTIIGNLQIYLENHRGVIQYNENQIRLAVNNGELIIKGHRLQIRNLFSEEIYIDGEIEGIEYVV